MNPLGMTEKRVLEVESASTPKSMRYDRQLRLWGDEGQVLLENATVCLFGATAIGCEILKNLVLPGVGAVSVVDHQRVTTTDIQTNFFLSPNSLNEFRGSSVLDHLQQLNPDVKTTSYNVPITEFINTHMEDLKKVSLFIISNTAYGSVRELTQIAWDSSIPVVYANCIGMYAELRLIVKEHVIVESKPDSMLPDLRLDLPFTELLDFYQNIDLANCTDTEHAHIPYVIILLKCLDLWRSTHTGNIPQNYREKTDFKKLIGRLRRSKTEENFTEAESNVNKCIVKTRVPGHVLELFEDARCTDLSATSSNFWVCLAAVKQFHNVKGVLPISGRLEDMTSDSQTFISLQRIYSDKAAADADLILSYVRNLCSKHGIPEHSIDPSYVTKFSRNCQFLRVFGTPHPDISSKAIREALEPSLDDASDLAHIPLLFQAHLRFREREGKAPGLTTPELNQDQVEVQAILADILKEYEVSGAVVPSLLLQDFVRFGGVEVPSVAAFSGGIGGHECIKLITRQPSEIPEDVFVPLALLRYGLLLGVVHTHPDWIYGGVDLRGFSYIQLAEDIRTHEQYAVKRLLAYDEEQITLIKDEIKYYKMFTSPHIIPLLDYDIKTYGAITEINLILPYYKNGSLQEFIDKVAEDQTRITERKIYSLLRGVCRALHVMHNYPSDPLIHYDIKPGNIMISDDGNAVLMDFGSAVHGRTKISRRSEALTIQDTAAERSTLPYRAPELLEVSSDTVIDEKVDVWSLGCTLYALAFLKSPFEYVANECGGSIALAALNRKIKYPDNVKYSQGFIDMIEFMLEVDPATRPGIETVIQKLDLIEASADYLHSDSASF